MCSPSVSVIVPVFNAEPFLQQCLSSLALQSCADIEIIVVNDGSTDKGLDLIRSFAVKEGRIVLISHHANRGLGAAYNTGMSLARGEYVAFVEPDDWVEKDFITTLLRAARESGTNVTRCGFNIIQPDCAVVESPHFAHLDFDIVHRFPLLLMGDIALGYIGFWAGLYRRDFLEKEQIRFLELPGAAYVDTHFFWMTHALAGELSVVRKPCYNYRLNHPGSSVKCRDSRWLALVTNYDQARHDLRQRGRLEKHEPIMVRAAARAYTSVCRLLEPPVRKEFCDRVSQSFSDVADDIIESTPASAAEKSDFLKLKHNTYFREWAELMAYEGSALERLRCAVKTMFTEPYVFTSEEFWELSERRSWMAQAFVFPLLRLDRDIRLALLKRGVDLFPHKEKRRSTISR